MALSQEEMNQRVFYITREISELISISPCIVTRGIPPYDPREWPTHYLERFYRDPNIQACYDDNTQNFIAQKIASMQKSEVVAEDASLAHSLDSMGVDEGDNLSSGLAGMRVYFGR
jgi:hypothetical protein